MKGAGQVPEVDPSVIDKMSKAYAIPYKMITGRELPPVDSSTNLNRAIAESIKTFLQS